MSLRLLTAKGRELAPPFFSRKWLYLLSLACQWTTLKIKLNIYKDIVRWFSACAVLTHQASVSKECTNTDQVSAGIGRIL